MRHATKRALAIVRGDDWTHLRADWRACDDGDMARWGAFGGALGYDEAEALLRGQHVTLPDCPRCAVLLDEALEKGRA